MQIQNAVITGSFAYNGVDLSSVTSSTSNISSINAITASILSTTGSLNTASGSAITRLGALEITSGSNITRLSALESASGSAITRLGALEVTSGSNITRISALETASGSAITRLGSIEVVTGSNITRLSSIETVTGSNITRLNSLEARTGSYATTGSNTFVEGQYLSSSYNPTGFSTTASLYTDGGLRVTRDAYISGTLYLNNVTVYGTQSVCYITSSQLNIASNLISVNTATPSVRFGGLAVYDSGSTSLTGSILWDSQNNHWVYSNPSGSSYSGGMFISGPRTSTLGSETGTTSCMLLAGQGGDHLTSSMIYHDNAVTCIPTAIVGGSTACFASQVCVTGNADTAAGLVINNGAGASGTCQHYINFTAGATTIARMFRGNGAAGLAGGGITIDNYDGMNIRLNQLGGSGGFLGISGGAACFSNTVCVGTNLVVRSAATFCDTVGLFGGSSQLYIGGSSAASDFAILQWCATNKSLNIHNQSTGNNGQLVITCEGSVVIGDQTALGSKLTIVSANDQAGITMYNTYDCNKWSLRTGTSGVSNKGFGIVDDICNATRLQIDGAGNVGIGTLSPGGRLDVVTCSNSTQNFYLRNTSNLDASSRAYFNVVAGNTSLSLLALAGGGSCGGTYIAGTCGADLYIQQAQGGTVNMIIKSDGKVGIGTSSPAGFLEIKCAQNTYNRIVACFEASYTSGFAFSDLNGGIKYDAGNNIFCIYSTYPNYGGVMIQTGASQRMLITSCGSVNIGTLATGKHNVEIGDIKNGPGGFAYCYFLVAQGEWATFACVTNGDTNVVTDITYVNNNDYNRSGVFVARWAYNAACAALHIVSCLWNDSQNINQFGLRNNGGALQICLGGGSNGYRVQARTQGARATG